MHLAESFDLLQRLRAWVTKPEYVYRHEWRMNDLLIWDNTGTMHRAKPYDMKCGRRLHRFTLDGEEPIRGPRNRVLMNIVDAQVHIGPGRIEETLAAMDALGIRSILIDEYWMGSKAGDPAMRVPHGAYRPVQPTAELAALLHPDRFSYLVRLDRKDQEVTTVIRMARDAPHARALRITPGMWRDEVAAFAAGEYGPICAAACDCGLPLFMFVPGSPRGRRAIRPQVSLPADRHRSLRGAQQSDAPNARCAERR